MKDTSEPAHSIEFVQDLQRQIERQSSELAALKEENNRLKDENQRYEKTCSSFEKVNERLQNANDQYENDLYHERENGNMQIVDLRSIIEAKDKELSRLREELDYINSVRTSQTKALTERNAEIERLKNLIAKWQDQYRDACQFIHDDKLTIESKDKEIAQLREDVKKIRLFYRWLRPFLKTLFIGVAAGPVVADELNKRKTKNKQP